MGDLGQDTTRLEDLILVSVDDHVIEPPNMFEAHVPKAYAHLAPRVVFRDDGSHAWSYDGQETETVGLNAVVTWPQNEWGFDPSSFAEMRPGCYDIHERVRDMNVNGVLGSMCFPSFVHFCGQLFARSNDLRVGHVMVQAYNDWHIDEWCGSYPGRFIPLAITPLWDPDLMAAEVRRVARKGCHAVTFSENPHHLGLPSLHDAHWNPFWEACADEGTIVCMHIGSSSRLPNTSPDAPIDVMITLSPINIVRTAADLVWGPLLRRYPSLKFALSEGGIGWIPYFFERIDRCYEQHKWTGQDFEGKTPSEVFRDHVVTCFVTDSVGIAIRDLVGLDGITWECDYPHSDSTWPLAPEVLMKSLAGVSSEDIAKITHRNAMRHFRYDPFAHRPQEICTVGALRAAAGDVDTSTKTRSQLRAEYSARS